MNKAIISAVYPRTIAERLNLEPGDEILSINGNPAKDLIDFQFLWADEEILLAVKKRNENSSREYKISKDYDESLGVEFEQAIFDTIKRCNNKCIFCFVDQMAPNLRNTLYIKDDDYRLSFLQGSFITLTNVQEKDISDIVRLHLSPLYISVHTTDEKLRREMLKNPRAEKIMQQLRTLSEAGIELHTQIVVCPGINDGDELEKTLQDLCSLGENIKSIAIVPVGVTEYAPNASLLKELTKQNARKIITQIEKWRKKLEASGERAKIYLSDEFFFRAEQEYPPSSYYNDFPQLENGVGISRLFLEEFIANNHSLRTVNNLQKFALVTGEMGEYVLKDICKELDPSMIESINIIKLKSVFWGDRVTVTGLLTGRDLVEGLKNTAPEEQLVIPDIMLKSGKDTFLDGMTVADIENKLGRKIKIIGSDAESLISLLKGG